MSEANDNFRAARTRRADATRPCMQPFSAPHKPRSVVRRERIELLLDLVAVVGIGVIAALAVLMFVLAGRAWL